MKLYGIFGTGGFGREIMPLAEAMLKYQLGYTRYELVFIDENTPPTPIINNHRVLNVDEFFNEQAAEKYFNIAIANSSIRKRIAEMMLLKGAHAFRINASNSMELHSNAIDAGAIFCPFSMVTSNAVIGKFFHANIYSYVAHDCMIGDYVTFAPNVHCNGGVIIENNVYVGTGVIIREGTKRRPLIIGEGAILGMGAVVTKSIPAFTTVVGNPAMPIRQREKATS